MQDASRCLGVCCLRSYAYVPGIPLTEDALRTVVSVGLHHSCRLHRGGCNPIPARKSRRAACEEEEEEEEKVGSAALRSDALSSTPPLSCRVSPSFSHHLFTPCSARLFGGSHASGIVASHCSPHPTSDRAPLKSARHGGAILSAIYLFDTDLFPPMKCLHRGNLRRARQSGDVPEHVHIRDGVGFT